MKLKSKDFQEGGPIPSEFTCDGRNISPQLSWDDVPQDVKSFALSLTDPDAPGGNFIHWLIHDIPKDTRSIELASVPKGARQVENDFRKRDYGGPCPPSGTHRYFFRLHALDVEHLEATSTNFFDQVNTHSLATAELKGLYKRKK
jgi:Raf kinase inhibitor-like YbhB/YbcL family protein